jgi:short-subunit dehydrogenase
LVNNAGVPQDKIVALHEFPRDKTLAILAVNACVPVLLTQALLPKLLAFAALKPA